MNLTSTITYVINYTDSETGQECHSFMLHDSICKHGHCIHELSESMFCCSGSDINITVTISTSSTHFSKSDPIKIGFTLLIVNKIIIYVLWSLSITSICPHIHLDTVNNFATVQITKSDGKFGVRCTFSNTSQLEDIHSFRRCDVLYDRVHRAAYYCSWLKFQRCCCGHHTYMDKMGNGSRANAVNVDIDLEEVNNATEICIAVNATLDNFTVVVEGIVNCKFFLLIMIIITAWLLLKLIGNSEMKSRTNSLNQICYNIMFSKVILILSIHSFILYGLSTITFWSSSSYVLLCRLLWI